MIGIVRTRVFSWHLKGIHTQSCHRSYRDCTQGVICMIRKNTTMTRGGRQYGMVFVTAPTKDDAEKVAQHLLEKQLAACCNIYPVTSSYMWQGKNEKEGEYQLTIKTDLGRFDELEHEIISVHPYDVPEIIGIPIVAGHGAYMKWIGENVADGSKNIMPTRDSAIDVD